LVTANENLMGTVSVSYLPAIAAAKQYSVSLEQLNVQLMKHQNLARQTGAITAAGMASQFNNQGVILDRYGRTLVDTNKKMETVTQAAVRQKKTVTELANSHSFLQHRMGWFISGTAFYGAINAAGQAYEAIKDVEMGMVEIARITDDVTFNFGKMRTELLQLGIDYGRSWEEVQDVAVRWAQAGYNVNDTITLTKDSLLALNTAELDAANATQSMIGIMSQWGLQAEDLLLVIDKINITADDFAITSQDIVDGLLRSSGAAKAFGMSLEQTIGIITAMREASGRTGREVGNALNTILTYASRPSTVNTLEAAGISFFADEARTKFRNLYDILNDVNIKWNELGETAQQELEQMVKDTGLITDEMANAVTQQEEWNDLQKRDVSMSIAGTRRRTYLIALLQNYAQAQNVVNNMTDAAGYSQRENARTMEALESKVKQLRTAFTMLAVEIGEAGLLDVMKGAVDTTREMIEVFEKLPPEFKKLIIMLGETAVLMGLLSVASKTFLNVGLSNGVKDLAVKLAGANKETVTFGGALLALAKTPVGAATIAFLALGSAVYQFSQWQAEANTRAAESIQKSLDSAERAKSQANEIERLTNEYKNLAKEGTHTAEENAKLESITKDLIDIMPGLASRFDEAKTAAEQYSGAIEYTTEQLRRLRAEAKEDIEFAAKISEDNIARAKEEMDKLKTKKDDLRTSYDTDDPIATLFGLHNKYGEERILDNISYKSPFVSQKERETRAKDALQRWEKEVDEEYKLAKEIYDKHEKAINLKNALTNAETMKPFTTPNTTPKIPPGGGGGAVLTAADRILAKQGYYQHLLRMGQISTEDYIIALEGLERQLIAVGGKEKDIWSIQEEIYSLRTKENQKAYEDMYSDSMDYYSHETSLSRMSRDEQIRYLRDLSQQHEWEKQKMWSLDEQIFRLYQDELKEQSNAIDKAYQDRMEKIDDERDATINSMQAQIDALDALNEKDNRAEAEKKHNEKIAELQKEIRYHELRTGTEHEEAILDINKKIEEEKRDWKKQQEDWSVEDKKRSLQQQIEDVKKAADEEKKVWKQKYDDIKAQWDEWATNFAQAAIDDPQWLNIGKTIGQQIVEGFSGSIGQMSTIISNAGGSASNAGGGGNSGGSHSNPTALSQAQRDAQTAYNAGVINQSIYDSIMNSHHGGLEGKMFADGKKFDPQTETIAKLLNDEVVLTKKQFLDIPRVFGVANMDFQFERLISAMQNNQIPQASSSKSVSIGTLLNVEKAGFEDRQDMEILSREIYRQIKKIS